MSDVKLVKLITGEELLADTEETETGIEITDVIAVVLQPGNTDPKTGKTQMAFAFLPWGTMASGSIHINNKFVIYISEPEEQVLAHYNNLFGRIQTPPKGLVIAR